MCRLVTLLGVLATVLAAGCGGGSTSVGTGGSSTRDAASTIDPDKDVLRARKALLTDADLGEGWESEDAADDAIVPAEFNCFPLDETGLSAHAAGDFYASGAPLLVFAGAVYPRGSHVVSSWVSVYGDESDARVAFSVAAAKLQTQPKIQCLMNANSISEGPSVNGGRAALFLPEKFPALGDETRAADYQITFKKDKDSKLYVDVVLVRDERAVGIAFLSSLEAPPLSQPFSEQAVADIGTLLAERLTDSRTR